MTKNSSHLLLATISQEILERVILDRKAYKETLSI